MSTKEINSDYLGHRERLRERFIKSGFNGFHDYEVLELLLTYCLPRKDTKPIAKDLLKRFKSINKILSADEQELKSIKGLATHSVIFLKVLNEFGIYQYNLRATEGEIQFLMLDQLTEYFWATIGNKKNEVVSVLYLNSQNKLLASEILSEGTVTESFIQPRKVVENALNNKATTVIIGHNHPGGIPEPSEEDNIITSSIKQALATVDISLQDHIIIADSGYYSYKQNGIL